MNTITEEPKAELALLPPTTALQLFEGGNVRTVLDTIKAEVRSIVTDPTTEKGRKEIASLAYKVAQTKTAMDAMGKSLTDEQRKFIDQINAERRVIVAELDALKEEVRRPLTEYENREKERVAKHQDRISRFIAATQEIGGLNSESLGKLISKTEAFDPSDMEEFRARAETEKAAALHRLGKLRDEIAAQEAEAARLEAERIERERIEREEREARIAAEAAEKARLAAEEEARLKAEAEAARVAEERRKAEEAREAERRAEAERLAKIEREKAEAQAAAERAERERIEAEERRKREVAEAEAKAARELAFEKARAAREAEEKEAARLAAIEAERAAEEKRAANKRHRASVIEAAQKAFEESGLTPIVSARIVNLIADGMVPAVSIQF